MTRAIYCALVVLAISLSVPSGLRAQSVVVCKPGISTDGGSGWCDFGTPAAFRKGERLRLAIGGSAAKIIVRLLPRGADAGTTIVPSKLVI